MLTARLELLHHSSTVTKKQIINNENRKHVSGQSQQNVSRFFDKFQKYYRKNKMCVFLFLMLTEDKMSRIIVLQALIADKLLLYFKNYVKNQIFN